MPERSIYFKVVFYDVKYISDTPPDVFKAFTCLKKAVANKSLNGTTKVVREKTKLKYSVEIDYVPCDSVPAPLCLMTAVVCC